MADIEKVINELNTDVLPFLQHYCDMQCDREKRWISKMIVTVHDSLELLKEQETPILTIDDAVSELMDRHYDRLEEQETEWEHLWDAPDGTFKGRCKKCGFVHFFIEGHDTQYKFCPECGRSVK